MKILVTGKGGNAGSWKIRGVQLGEALEADVRPMASSSACRNADVIIVVKRTPPAVIETVRASGKPWVYDIVDGWPQPSSWGKESAVTWLRETLDALRPTAVVFGTPRMQFDSKSDLPSLVLPHHSWSKYCDREPVVRGHVKVVGYEGAPQYLARWMPLLIRETGKRGWELNINGDLAKADIGIALRDLGGYPAAAWKPGTKLSNLHALGIPALCSREAGYEHVQCGAEYWIDNGQQLVEAFDALSDKSLRVRISQQMRAAMLPVAAVATQYRTWLETLL